MLTDGENGQDPNQPSLETGLEEEPLEEEPQPSPSPIEAPTVGLDTPAPVPGAVDFSHPSLRGRTPREIELYVQQLERGSTPAPAAPAAPATLEPEEELEWSWENPTNSFRKFEDRIARLLERTVAPFKEQAVKTEAEQIRSDLRIELTHFARLEPTINTVIKQNGGDPSKISKAQLTQMYYTTLGYMSSQGIDLNVDAQPTGGDVTTQPQGDRRPPAPPQHRPSAAPLPAQPKPKAPVLTENEARLARERGLSAEEYVRLRDAEPGEIVKPGFSTAGA